MDDSVGALDSRAAIAVVNPLNRGRCGCLVDVKLVDKSSPDSETYLTDEDFKRAKLGLNDGDKTVDDSEMYNSNRFEGDIDDVIETSCLTFVCHTTLPKIHKFQLLKLDVLDYGDGLKCRAKIADVFEEYTKFTCIKFTPKTDEDYDYIHIFPDDGCYSMVGRVGGRQEVSLASGCLEKGIIIHELMHTVGFFHEQSRADRDDYVTILWENIQDGLSGQLTQTVLFSLNIIEVIPD
uniref:Metalloendopeptidase n=1 Tax=Parascaris univalens TaxID=6257 RepID=A0A915ANV2_PARUN